MSDSELHEKYQSLIASVQRACEGTGCVNAWELRQQIDVLRAEVKAWRDWRKLVVRYMTCEQPDPTVRIDSLKAAMAATDAANALDQP